MKNKEETTFSLKRLWVLILLPLAVIIISTARYSSGFCDFYVRYIYPVMSGSINFLFSMTGVSVAQIIIVLFAALIVFYTLTVILALIFSEHRLKRFITYVVNMVCLAAMIIFIFSITCGINYYRPSFAETEGIEVSGATRQELADLLEDLVLRLNEAREEFDGTYRSFSENAVMSEDFIKVLSERYRSLSGDYGPPKPVSFFGWMSLTNITGFFFPFTFEANVNDTIPEVSIPATMCHELAHLRGHMREDEANYIAYLACVESGDPEFAYSGLMLAYSHTSSALYSEDPDLCRSIISGLSDEVKKDISDRNEYWKKYEGVVAEISDAVNDLYLKANDRPEGVKSYGRMVDLLISEFRSTKNGSGPEQSSETEETDG